jgi:rSAM/selenodomain-associated transferase 1
LTAIAIFVKTPGLSAVKTRLAATIGPARAAALYQHCAAAVAEAATGAAVGAVYWATAEPIDRIDEQWPDLPLLEQGSGGLGARMHRVLDQLVQRHGSGLLLGADAPQLDPAILRRAARWLQREVTSSVIGPAADGGFWTFGANHLPDLSCWTRVPYSHPDTLLQFRHAIGDESEWLELPTLTDLDTAEDMARVAGELAALPHPLPRQRDLMAQLR